MTWLTLKAWPWLKKNWMWVVFPIGILVFIATYRKLPDIISSETIGAGNVKRDADEKAEEKTEEAKAEQKAALEKVKKEHAGTIAKLTRKQRDQLEELRDDPDKVNAFLKSVGESIRGG